MSPSRKDWIRVALALVAFKIVYLALISIAFTLWPSYEDTTAREIDAGWFDNQADRWVPQENSIFARHFATWDAEHYLFLSAAGYAAGERSCAFYPLWPLVIRWFSVVTGGDHLIAGMFLANIFSLVGWVLFYRVVAKRFDKEIGRWSLVCLIAFPGALFYQFVYTEPLFFLLVMLLWWGLDENRFGMAWIAAFLLPLSRAVGFFSLLPIGWHWLMRRHWGWVTRWRWLEAERERANRATAGRSQQTSWKEHALLAAPPLGLGLYFVLMWVWTGSPFEGIHAQKYWGVHSIGNLWNVPKFVVGFFEPTSWHRLRGSVLDRCLFLLLLYCLPKIWRLGKDLLLWTYVLGILPAMSGTFASYTRFGACVFPVFIALAVFSLERKRNWPLLLFVFANALLQGILLWRFVNFRWAG